VHCGSATAMPYGDGTFSGVVSFTMLHHVPSIALQDQLFSEAYRVLEPGGTFVGVDSLGSWWMRVFHVRDTLVLVDPLTLSSRLEAKGFRDVSVETSGSRFRFVARRPF
jgi:SAM-dependent methyltransferase